MWQFHCQQPSPVIGLSMVYDATQPDATYKLPGELREISGLSWHDGSLWAIQDEDGILYRIDPGNQPDVKILKTHFGPHDDYEALEWLGNYCYVVTSEAKLWQVDPVSRTSQRLPSFWGKNHNVEGLTQSADGLHLILAAKEEPHNKERKVTLIDPDPKTPVSTDLFTIKNEDIKKFIVHENTTGLNAPEKISFNPAALSIHPVSGDLFVISSPEPQLLVLDTEGNIKSWQRLSAQLFPQPEAMCFDPDGTLYIANEGKHGPATLLLFYPKKS